MAMYCSPRVIDYLACKRQDPQLQKYGKITIEVPSFEIICHGYRGRVGKTACKESQ